MQRGAAEETSKTQELRDNRFKDLLQTSHFEEDEDLQRKHSVLQDRSTAIPSRKQLHPGSGAREARLPREKPGAGHGEER